MTDAALADTPAPRRTQAERSEAMRQRLIDATLQCLRSDGYAGTTVSRIIEVAQVSRGAPLHHFPSKAALIAAAAEQLVRQIYRQMGRAIAQLESSDDRLHDMIYACWKEVVNQPENVALAELTLASQRDPELATILRELWNSAYDAVGAAAEHYFEPVAADDKVRHLMALTQWLLRGIAMDRHLIISEEITEHYLRQWSRIVA
ncbi:MAG TPA: TetR/AcrR family transcriptional regulator, partial [Moraxellaceae bacterium]